MSYNLPSKGCELCLSKLCFACSAPPSFRRLFSPFAPLSCLFCLLFRCHSDLLYRCGACCSGCLCLPIFTSLTRSGNALINHVGRQHPRGEQDYQIGRDDQRIEICREPAIGDANAEEKCNREQDILDAGQDGNLFVPGNRLPLRPCLQQASSPHYNIENAQTNKNDAN